MNQSDEQRQVVESPELNTTGQRHRPHWVRAVVVVAAAVLTMGLVAGCGDDEDEQTSTEETSTEESGSAEGSSEEAFCAAGDSLESNVEGLGDIDIVAEGTDALDAQFDAIKSDLEDLRSSGSDVAAEEIAALETAVDQLEVDLDALGDDVSAEGASAVGDSVNSVATAARAVRDRLDATCP